MALTVGELTGILDLDDVRWKAATAAAHEDLSRLSKKVGDFGDKSLASFARAANGLAALPTAANGIGAVVGILGSMSGAIGLIPAAGAGALIAITALKTGMQGFGDAVKNAGDPAAFAESLKELSPEARKSAVAVRDLSDEWSAMQDHVQDQLFEGLADDIRALGTSYIPVLAKGLGDVNAQFNAAAQRTAQWLTQSQQVSTVSGIFDQVGLSVADLSRGLQPIVQILLDIVAVGSEFVPGLTGGFGDAAQAAAEFVRNARETGQLHDWISTGLSTLGDLWQLLKNIGSIVGTVFGAFRTEGADTLTMLIGLTGQIRDFLRSVEGQEALHSLAEALGTVASVVSQVLIAALRQLAPIIVQAAPGFAQLAQQVGGILVDAITTAGPMLTQLAGWLSDNIDWLGPLALGLFAAAKAFGVVSTAVQVLGMIASVNPWVIIIAGIVTLVTLIVTHWEEIKAAVSAAIDWIVGFVERNWPLLIGIILGPLGVIVGLVIQYWDEIKAVIAAAWDAIVGWVRDKVNMVMRIMDRLGELGARAQAWFGGLVMAALWKTQELLNWIGSLPGRILGYLGDLGGLLVNAGRALIDGLIRGVSQMASALYNKMMSIAQNAYNSVLSFFGIASPSREMQWVGQMIGEGLALGLASMTSTVAAAADQLSDAATITPGAPALAGAGGLGGPGFGTATGDRAAVVIENYHPPADASAYDVASDLDWFARGGG